MVRVKLQKALFKALLSCRVMIAKGKVTGDNTASAGALLAKVARPGTIKSTVRKRKWKLDALCTPSNQPVDESVTHPAPKKQSLDHSGQVNSRQLIMQHTIMREIWLRSIKKMEAC